MNPNTLTQSASKTSTLAAMIRYASVSALALFMAACSDDNDEGVGPEEEELSNIVEIASSNPDFETLTAAIVAAKLDDDLSAAGPFTVFAPTDAAFDALPEGTVEALLQDPEGDLKNILLYHVVSGKVEAETVVTLTKATTLLGKDVTIKVVGGKVYLNDDVMVTVTDLQASNGVIHVIDAVLLPPADEPASSSSAVSSSSVEASSSSAGPGTIVDIASSDSTFETLTAAVIAAKLDGTLSGEGPFTVFAPTDAAFDALPAGTLTTLLADPEGDLKDILLYHVVSGKVEAETVVTLTKAGTVLGKDVTIKVEGGKVFLNDVVEVIVTDIQASNGVIHVIDAVLLPPADVVVEAVMAK